jgi:hypothetical protein
MKNLNFILPAIQMEDHLFNKVDEKIRPVLYQKGAVIDIWGVAVKKTQFSKRILGNMMNANILLGQEACFLLCCQFQDF